MRPGPESTAFVTQTDRRLPAIIAHADWSTDPCKRWIALAHRDGTGYAVDTSRRVGDTFSLLTNLAAQAGDNGAVLAGFDFPIGLPRAYAARAGISRFLAVLPEFGAGEWKEFYEPAGRPAEIGIRRPFYPRAPGGTCRADLWQGLGLSDPAELWRRCDRKSDTRPAACALFWTLGGNQVGRAAISGWRDLLAPALRSKSLSVKVWPFDGRLAELLPTGQVVVAETYPTEFYRHLGVRFTPVPGRKWGKRVQADRCRNAPALEQAAERLGVTLIRELPAAVRNGFGAAVDSDDAFDAFIGLLGMLNVLRGFRSSVEPDDPAVRNVEGWIFGQEG